jgi:hypothetical protein
MVPITITDAMILGGTTIAEPAAGETAWVSAGTYAMGNERIRATTHRVYECIQAHTGRTALPEVDGAFWLEKRPTLRHAPLDDYSNTKARTVTTMTYVLQPGFINGLWLSGIEGTSYTLTVKTAPGGTVIKSESGDLFQQAAGFYELLYTPLLQTTQLSFDGIPMSPTAEVTITIASASGAAVALGTIKVGDWRYFVGDGAFGGTQYGAEADRTSYSYREYFDDGTYRTVKRPSSRDIRLSVAIDAEQSMYADAILAEIIDTAVPFEASNIGKYGYLNTLGFVTGSMRADNFGVTSLNLNIKGNT